MRGMKWIQPCERKLSSHLYVRRKIYSQEHNKKFTLVSEGEL